LLSFRGMGVDGSNEIQLLSGVPKCRGGAELSLLAVERTTGSLREELEEFLRRAENGARRGGAVVRAYRERTRRYASSACPGRRSIGGSA
jgi:hypothetical protein